MHKTSWGSRPAPRTLGWTFQVPGQTISPNIAGEVAGDGRQGRQTMGLCFSPRLAQAALNQGSERELTHQKHSGPPDRSTCLCPRPRLPGVTYHTLPCTAGRTMFLFPGEFQHLRGLRRTGLGANSSLLPPDVQTSVSRRQGNGQWTELSSYRGQSQSQKRRSCPGWFLFISAITSALTAADLLPSRQPLFTH